MSERLKGLLQDESIDWCLTRQQKKISSCQVRGKENRLRRQRLATIDTMHNTLALAM